MFRIFSPNYSTGEPRNCYSTFIRSASGYPVQRKSGNAPFNFCYSRGLRPLARADLLQFTLSTDLASGNHRRISCMADTAPGYYQDYLIYLFYLV
jgi:hypothetical protein